MLAGPVIGNVIVVGLMLHMRYRKETSYREIQVIRRSLWVNGNDEFGGLVENGDQDELRLWKFWGKKEMDGWPGDHLLVVFWWEASLRGFISVLLLLSGATDAAGLGRYYDGLPALHYFH